MSAADNQTDIVAEENDMTTQEILTDEDTTPGNFKELYNILSDYTSRNVTLEKDYVYNPATDSGYIKGVIIGNVNANGVIEGNGHTIDGAGIARIMKIEAHGVTLKNINFVNGKIIDEQNRYGGAIYCDPNKELSFTIINCTFTNNTARSGGAVYAYSITMENCTSTTTLLLLTMQEQFIQNLELLKIVTLPTIKQTCMVEQ